LEAEQVQWLLLSCNRSTALGSRDFAILMLLCRLGLRSCEVAGLRLDDIDWRAGELTIRGEGSRTEQLPLPLRCRRGAGLVLAPSSSERLPDVVLEGARARWPMSGAAIGGVVHDACVRAGIPPVGPHRLRHIAATGILRQLAFASPGRERIFPRLVRG
jgi:integrase/recombinase XerD